MTDSERMLLRIFYIIDQGYDVSIRKITFGIEGALLNIRYQIKSILEQCNKDIVYEMLYRISKIIDFGYDMYVDKEFEEGVEKAVVSLRSKIHQILIDEKLLPTCGLMTCPLIIKAEAVVLYLQTPKRLRNNHNIVSLTYYDNKEKV